MHIIVHTIPVKPNSLELARAFFEERVPPLAERFSGWRGARLCRQVAVPAAACEDG